VATIQRAVLEEADLSLFAADGELRLEEIVDELLDQLAERPTQLVLWDLSSADLSHAANAAIVDLAWHIKGPVIRMHGGRMAMVCPRNSEFDVARMFRDAAARLRVPLEVSVFRGREEAVHLVLPGVDEVRRDEDEGLSRGEAPPRAGAGRANGVGEERVHLVGDHRPQLPRAPHLALLLPLELPAVLDAGLRSGLLDALSTGSTQSNEELSVRRAEAVKTILVGRGVSEAQIATLGLGETKPIASNDQADGRAKNRRVEVHIDVPNPT